MTLVIDTGVQEFTPLDLIPDWYRDIHPIGTPPEKVMHDYGYHLIGAMNNPKKLETVRTHVLAQWRFIAALAAVHPGVFDEIMTAYAERVLSA